MNERLRRALIAAHMTRDALAEATNVDPKTVQRWLKGRVPYARHRWKIAELLKVDEDVLWPTVNSSIRNDPEDGDVEAVHRLLIPGTSGPAIALDLVVRKPQEASLPEVLPRTEQSSSTVAFFPPDSPPVPTPSTNMLQLGQEQQAPEQKSSSIVSNNEESSYEYSNTATNESEHSLQAQTHFPQSGANDASSLLSSVLNESVPLTIMTSRRQMLQEILALASFALLTPPYELLDGDAQDRLAFAVSRSASLDERVLTDLDTITNAIWRTREHGVASLELLDNALGHFQTIVHLLKRAHGMNIRHRLHSVARNAAQLLGHLLFDIRDFATAWSYYTFALNAAQWAHQPDEEAAVLGLMSFVLTYNTHPSKTPSETVNLLERAQNLTAHSTTIPLRASLAAIKAEVHANLGQRDSYQREIDRSQDFVMSLKDQNDAAPDDIFNFDHAAFRGYQGACLLRIGKPLEALQILQDSVQDPKLIHAVRLTHFGIAHAQLGAYSEACDFGLRALSMIAHTRSHSQFQCVHDLRHDLEAWAHTSEVKDLDHHIEIVHAMLRS